MAAVAECSRTSAPARRRAAVAAGSGEPVVSYTVRVSIAIPRGAFSVTRSRPATRSRRRPLAGETVEQRLQTGVAGPGNRKAGRSDDLGRRFPHGVDRLVHKVIHKRAETADGIGAAEKQRVEIPGGSACADTANLEQGAGFDLQAGSLAGQRRALHPGSGRIAMIDALMRREKIAQRASVKPA